MLRFLGRFLRAGSGTEPARGAGTRFTPALEVLDGRAMPSVAMPAVVDDVGGWSDGIVVNGGASGGVTQDSAGADSPSDTSILGGSRKIGEEMPALSGGARGGVDMDTIAASPGDGVSVLGGRRVGEELPELTSQEVGEAIPSDTTGGTNESFVVSMRIGQTEEIPQ